MLAVINIPVNLLLIGLVLGILPIWFLWRALDRAGLVGAMSLLCLIPLGVYIVLGMLAFAPWPNLPEKQTDPLSRRTW